MALTQVSPGLLDSNAQYYGFKNRIINGAMGIWQRGTSGFTTLGNYCTDRWFANAGTSLSAVAQSSDAPSGFKYSVSVAGTNVPQIVQRIESLNCTDLGSQNVTVSFWAKQTSGAGSNSLFLQLLYPNSADNYAGVTQIGSNQFFTGTSGWVQYSYTFTSIPSNAVNGLQVIIGANTAGAATFLITGVQLEKSSTATSFDYRPYGTELALCQRYLPVVSATASSRMFVGYFVTTTALAVYIPFQVQARVAPTGISLSGSFNASYLTATQAITPVWAGEGSTGGAVISATVGSATTAGQAMMLSATAAGTATIQFTGCEL